MMKNNVLANFLEELKVKYTQSYSIRLFEEHPHKYDLYGISKMLRTYNIPTTGIRVSGKDIHFVDPPFIAHVGNDFVVVNRVKGGKVNYSWNNKNISITEQQFQNLWTGVALVAEPTLDSCEPDYQKHYFQECLGKIQSAFLYCVPFLALIILCARQSFSVINALLLLCNIVGSLVCFLLLQKQLFSHNQYADKICSLFKQKECNDVLESDAAKLFGWLSWSEVGLGYFMVNAFIIGFSQDFCAVLAVINVCVLPYTVWSIYYQSRIAKQWCMLCLIVQCLIWIIFLLSLFAGYIRNNIDIVKCLPIAISYLFAVLAINKISSIVAVCNNITDARQKLNGLKAMEDVFRILLKRQPYYKVGVDDSCICFGNAKASLKVTVLTNPHCNPCARMHERIENILEKAGDNIQVQYIFSSFNDELKRSNQFLIAVYLNENEKEIHRIYEDWYGKGKYSAEQYISGFNYHLDDAAVIQEMKKHDDWKERNKISATPTILINGYLLPEEYKIEDIIEFVNMNDNL